jgi:hypothetical protein
MVEEGRRNFIFRATIIERLDPCIIALATQNFYLTGSAKQVK